MDKHGPMEINDERLSGQLAILPENSQTLIKNFGGLEKFLLSSSAFVKQEGLICLAEYAAVVAASMNSNGSDQDMLVSSGYNFKSKEVMMKDTHGLNYGQAAMGYPLKQKGHNKIAKDPSYGASKQPGNNSTGVPPSKTPYSKNSSTKYESSTKKNISVPQSQRLVTPSLGGINDASMASGKSTYSDKLSAGKHTSTKHQSVSTSLDPAEIPLPFSVTSDRRISVVSSSASTELSQEVPGIEDEIIGNLFDYNNYGTGSSNYLSPATDGFFPNAYPIDQGDSTILSDIATVTTDTESFDKTGKKTVVNEMVVTTDVMSSAKSMKMMKADMKMNSTASYTSGENVHNFGNNSVGSLSSSSVHHMEPVYLPPPPVQKITDKKDASVLTDQVYIYSENYKEKYETEVKARNELLKRLEDTEDRRVQMSNAHAMELDRGIKQARNDAIMVSSTVSF